MAKSTQSLGTSFEIKGLGDLGSGGRDRTYDQLINRRFFDPP